MISWESPRLPTIRKTAVENIFRSLGLCAIELLEVQREMGGSRRFLGDQLQGDDTKGLVAPAFGLSLGGTLARC